MNAVIENSGKETGRANQSGMNDLPWISEMKEMADLLQEQEHLHIEKWPLWQLAGNRYEVVLICLAFHYGWQLRWSGRKNSYIATRQSASALDRVHAWQETGHGDDPIRLGVQRTEDGGEHRYTFRFAVPNPAQSAASHAQGIHYCASRMLYLPVAELGNMSRYFRDGKTGEFISHEVIHPALETVN